MNKYLFTLCFVTATTLGGCASMKYGDKAAEADLKKFEAVPGKVSVYVCREAAVLFGAGIKTVAFVDNVAIGTLKPNTFAHVTVAPGKHAVYLRKDGLATGNSGVLDVEGAAGDIAFVWAGKTGGGFGALTVDRFDSTSDAMQCVKSADYSVRAD